MKLKTSSPPNEKTKQAFRSLGGDDFDRMRTYLFDMHRTMQNQKTLLLSVSGSSPFDNSYTRQKTSIRALKSLRLSETQKRIVLVLKHWRIKHDVPIGSHLLENLVRDAYAYAGNIPNGFTKKVIMVLRHVAKNLDVAVIRGIENSNNVITNIDPAKKQQIIESCQKAIDEYEYQPNTIKSIF